MEGDVHANEDFDLRPVSLYAETKVAAELEVLGRAQNGLAATCLRFATVYGISPRMRFDLTVNEFTRDIWSDRRLVVYGEQFWRPYIHVRDAALAVVTALEAPADDVAGEVFNAAAPTRTTGSSTSSSCSRSACRTPRSSTSTRTRIRVTTA